MRCPWLGCDKSISIETIGMRLPLVPHWRQIIRVLYGVRDESGIRLSDPRQLTLSPPFAWLHYPPKSVQSTTDAAAPRRPYPSPSQRQSCVCFAQMLGFCNVPQKNRVRIAFVRRRHDGFVAIHGCVRPACVSYLWKMTLKQPLI